MLCCDIDIVTAAKLKAFSEQKRDTPNTAESHKGVDYTADDVILTAEKKGNYIKLKQSDRAPVKSTDNA